MDGSTGAVRLLGHTRADALEVGEFVGSGNAEFEDQPILDGSSGDIALGAIAILATAAALKGLVAYIIARYPPKAHTTLVFERVRDGETSRITIKTEQIDGDLATGLAEKLGSFAGIPVAEILGA